MLKRFIMNFEKSELCLHILHKQLLQLNIGKYSEDFDQSEKLSRMIHSILLVYTVYISYYDRKKKKSQIGIISRVY